MVILGGCSVTYTDNNGYEHSFGLVHQKIKTTDQMIYLQKDTIGVNVSLSSEDGGATIGYKNSVRVFVPEDSVLTIDNQEGEIKANLKKSN